MFFKRHHIRCPVREEPMRPEPVDIGTQRKELLMSLVFMCYLMSKVWMSPFFGLCFFASQSKPCEKALSEACLS
jgi:hypothetical protein